MLLFCQYSFKMEEVQLLMKVFSKFKHLNIPNKKRRKKQNLQILAFVVKYMGGI